MDIEAANRTAFLVLNAPASLNGLPLELVIGAAQYGDAVLIALMVWRWALGTSRDRRVLIWLMVAVLAAMTINYVIGQAFPHPRPFVVGLGHTFISHRPNASFPSDHGTFMWTVALGLLFVWPRQSLSWLAVILAALTSWARVFLGLHFPLDMLGSLAVAGLCIAALAPMRGLIESRIARPIEATYGRGVRRLARSDPDSDLNSASS